MRKHYKPPTPDTVAPVATADEVDPLADTVPITLLALELGEDVDRLGTRLGDLVLIDDVGMRCVSAATTRTVIAERDAKRAAAQEESRRRIQRNAAAREAHRAARLDREVLTYVQSARVDELVASGMTPAAAIVALDGEPQFDGERQIPRMGSNPFTFRGDEGGRIGPAPLPRRKRGRKS